jgi:hypothetical protein
MPNVFLFVFFTFLFLSQGCAVGNKYNFSDTRANLQASSELRAGVTVATLDQRSTVVSGECLPTYVGMQRGGFGNPWRVNTESGLPLADDVTKSVSQSLSQKGFKTIPVFVAYNQSQEQVLALLLAKRTDRSILILLKRWESDTYMNIGLDYELRLLVFGPNQTVIAENSIAENKTLPGSFWNPPEAAREQIPIAFKDAIEKLLNDPKIVAVLK